VLMELGLPTIEGYKPYSNYQDALGRTIERYLIEHPDVLTGASLLTDRAPASVDPHDIANGIQVIVDDDPPQPGPPRAPRPAGLERLVRKFDPVARDFRNRALGKTGEAIVVDFERRRLQSIGRTELAKRVRWVSEEDGDGAGYDIHSYDHIGNDRLIEVKTTQGARSTPFFLTRNELSLAHERPEHFRLYRLYEVTKTPRLYKLKPPLEEAVTLEAETWRASVRL